MRLGTYPYNKRQELRFLHSDSILQSKIVYTPKFDFMTSRILVDLEWNALSGASLTSFQSILTSLGFSATAPNEMTTPNGRLNARTIMSSANFRSQFTDNVEINFNLFGNIPAKNQVRATDLILRDMLFCGVQPFIEWNVGGGVGRLRIAFWINFERPFMNESATIFSVKNQNTISVSLPNLVATGGQATLYYASSVVEQKYLFYESGQTIYNIQNAVFSVDESNVQSVYLYDSTAIEESALMQTFLNGIMVGEAFPRQVRYNSLLDCDSYPIASGVYFTSPDVIAPQSIDFGFIKVFEHPVLNLPSVSNKNRNFRLQYRLSSPTNMRYFFTKIVETDAARLESESYVQRMQGVFTA